MIGWLITGAVVVAALRAKAPAPAAPVVSLSPVLPLPVVTARVVAPVTRTPAAVTSIQPKPALPSPVIVSGGNEPLVPLSSQASASIEKGAVANLEGGLNWSLQNQISMEQQMGIYTGYGVPLSGPGFAPLASTDAGTFVIDSGSIGFSAGPLAG